MSSFHSYFNHHAFWFWLVLVLIVLGLGGWIALISANLRSSGSQQKAVLRNLDRGNIPAMLADYLTTVHSVSRQMEQMTEQVNALYESLPVLIRHVGLVRFSPFADTGGDQSFSLALLDARGDGVVLSALHSRQGNKLYAKPIVAGSSPYPLTGEEKRAIDESVRTTSKAEAIS